METQKLEIGREYVIDGITYQYLGENKDLELHTFANYEPTGGIRRAEIFSVNLIGVGENKEIKVVNKRDVASSVIFSDEPRDWIRREYSRLDKLLGETA
jgi:hypothetical protein